MNIDLRMFPPSERRRIEKMLHIHSTPPNEHKVFVYGTLLTGERNAHWAHGARRWPAWTHGTIYDTGYGFPAIVRKGSKRILGEVLTCNEEQFASMDSLEGYPRLYRREQIDVFTQGGGRVRAWVYIMNHLPENAKEIVSGSWRKRNLPSEG